MGRKNVALLHSRLTSWGVGTGGGFGEKAKVELVLACVAYAIPLDEVLHSMMILYE